jgi:hypothetical protein
MQEVKVRFPAEDLAVLDRQVAVAGVSRAELVRNRALSPALPRLTVSDYHRLVSDATTYMRGDLRQQHVEHLIAYVITRLDQHSRQADAGHQPAQ